MKNAGLQSAQNHKHDEFYTQLCDIEKEMVYYKDFFHGKSVYCNCDDWRYSNFWRYFEEHFDELGLCRLTATCWREGRNGLMADMWYDVDGLHRVNSLLVGEGDFRSGACREVLRDCDVVVTNPPFSLFREHMAMLFDYGKDFIVLGNMNAVTYKEVSAFICDGRLWYGASIHSGDREFGVPRDYPLDAAGWRVDEYGNKYIRVKGVRWFTNVQYETDVPFLELTKRYSPDEYPKYDNYDAININKVADIPADYDGVMGVPITFLDKYNPEQFEVIGLDRYTVPKEFLVGGRMAVGGKRLYARLLIKRKDMAYDEEQ